MLGRGGGMKMFEGCGGGGGKKIRSRSFRK